MNYRCANCKCLLANLERTGESNIYSPNKAFELCNPCWLEEDEEIDAKGTNVLPERLQHYYESENSL